DWDLAESVCNKTQAASIYTNVNDIVKQLVHEAKAGDHLVIISNGSFDGLHKKLISALQQKYIKHD
ncbi:MAG: UDP-N-acetylmuramate:L-alanyl-gamma-D-glutamyl-meso-diaminopimelate ligase, partial [Gammaproteobacteria bacterium]|nr:UDP-N-acetylmuramate:L-alanyl-gamma-D-glutamyl-meso-diaminopimelate ligase [Gammaproteobacteria bacterium]